MTLNADIRLNAVRAMLVVLVFGLVATGCGDDSSETSSSASASEKSADVEYAAAEVEKYRGVPEFTPPEGAEPFDTSKLTGKRVFYVPVGSQFQLQKVLMPIMQSALKDHGIRMDVFENQGTPAEWAKGVEQGVSQRYDAILTQGNNPQYYAPSVRLANRAGIPVIPSWNRTPANPPTKGLELFGEVFAIDQLAGKLQAEWVIADAAGEPVHALAVTSSDQVIAPPQLKETEKEFQERCGSDCKVTVVDVPGAQWAQKLQSEVQSALQANPDVNYVLPFATAMQQFVVPAIQAVGGQGRIKSAAFNGTPFGLDMIRSGAVVAMDVGQDLQCLGMMAVDNVMRALADLEPVENIDPETGWGSLPVRVWDKSNVGEAGVPATFLDGYGSACADHYERIWSGE